MTFKLKDNYLFDKIKKLKPYTTKQEKEILLADDLSPEEALKILSDVEPLNDLETIFLLRKLREISVSDVVEGMINCPECGNTNEFQVDLLDYNEDDLDRTVPIGLFMNLEEIMDTDEISLLDYNKLQKIIMKNNTILLKNDRSIECRLPTCRHKIPLLFDNISILSKSSLKTFYQEMYNFGKFLGYSNSDVESLLPFERSLLFSLMKKDNETPKDNPFV